MEAKGPVKERVKQIEEAHGVKLKVFSYDFDASEGMSYFKFTDNEGGIHYVSHKTGRNTALATSITKKGYEYDSTYP